MKLKFTIQYGTQWGESMHVVLCCGSQDGTLRTSNLLMTTQDGLWWKLETAVLESRQHPVSTITYYYQVEDAEGTVLRKEWSQVPRTYWSDSSKNYVFNDQWCDMPLCAHLYSNAYLTTVGKAVGEHVEARRLPLYRKTIIFRVSAPQLTKGHSLALLGSHPAMGSWSTARYLRMEYIGQQDWILSVNVDVVPMPIEYKYVVVDDQTHELTAWEEGDNRMVQEELSDGEVRVCYGGILRMKEKTWRAAGVVIPVFALRSEHSCGVGDFGDLKRMVDWAVDTGMKLIQLLPVNDTTTDGRWHDSYPYNITSCFALHPHYLDLEQLGELTSKKAMTAYRRQQRELNALPYSDYEAVERVKSEYVNSIFAERGEQTLASNEFKAWFEDNKWWLEPYAMYNEQCTKENVQCSTFNVQCSTFNVQRKLYVQYHLHLQLKAAADYARSRGVVLKGDVPIGVNRDSVETAQHPELFNRDCQTGAPPDAFSPLGQNWGFPTYNWEVKGKMLKVRGKRLEDWMRQRYRWMEQYFDAIRIDHVLGFFRIWEIPCWGTSRRLCH